MKRIKTPFWRTILSGVLAVAMLLTAMYGLTGCVELPGEKTGGAGTEQASVELPGELVRIREESSAGSMEPRSEFLAEVTPEEIVRAEYWPEKHFLSFGSEISVKEHKPIRPGQWADLVRIVTDLWPVFEEIPESSGDDGALTTDDGEEIFVLDGGDYWRLYLTFRAEDGEERTVRVYHPSDRRITTLDTLLRELVDPAGRKIVWYEPPALNGIFVHSDAGDYSFQFTYYSWDNCYYFISRYPDPDGGGKTDVSVFVPSSDWTEPGKWFASLGLERFPEGNSFRDPLTITLYYDDDTQTTVQPDEQTAAVLYDYFVSLTERYK